MKKIIILFLVLSSNVVFSQNNILFDKYGFRDVPWTKFELSVSDSMLFELIEKNKTIKQLHGHLGDNIIDYCHPIDIDNDMNIDILFYWQTSIQHQLALYVNDGKILNKAFNQFINLTQINHCLPSSMLKFYGITGLISGYPEASQLTEISVFSTGKYEINECVYYLDTEIPEVFDIKIPFKVINDKYRLRTKPEIDNGDNDNDLGNIIGEFATNDHGIALAESKDQTGRIWWFVMMNNNISKDKSYLHVDNDNSGFHRKKKVFGWISSRYLKTY
jgi:hypothetical protein